MNYVFISVSFPDNFKYFVNRLNSYGINVFGIASDNFDALDPDLREHLSDYYRVNDLENYEEVYRAVAYLAYRFGKIDYIESHNEHWMELDAKLRTDFNVDGIKNNSIMRIKKKSEMKKIFESLNLAHDEGATFNTLNEAKKLAKKYKYPVCVKPDIGVGAAYTYRINSNEDLESFYASKPDKTFIMEPYNEGSIMTYDGLLDKEGKIVFDNSLVYSQPVIDIVNSNLDMFYYTELKVNKELKEMGKKICDAYQLHSRFFHFEFFKSSDGKLSLLEVNMRPPGGKTMDMFNFANDFDFYDAYARIVANQELSIPQKKLYSVCHVGLKTENDDKRLLKYDQIKEQYGDLIVYEGSMADILSPALGNYCFFLRSKKVSELKKAAHTIIR